MGAITAIVNSAVDKVGSVLETSAWVAGDSEAALRVVKIGRSAIDAASEYSDVKQCVELSKKFKVANHFCDFIGFFSIAKGILYPNEKGQYIWNDPAYNILNEKTSNCLKTTETCLLFALKLLTFTTDEKFGFLQKGILNDNIGSFINCDFLQKGYLGEKFGSMKLFEVVIDALVISSSVVSMFHTRIAQNKLAVDILKTNMSLQKWNDKKEVLSFAQPSSGMLPPNQEKIFDRLSEHYEKKIAICDQEYDKLVLKSDQDGIDRQEEKDVLSKKYDKLHARLVLLTENRNPTLLFKEFTSDASIKPGKIQNKCKYYEGLRKNNEIEKNNLYWKMVNNIAKIGSILFAYMVKTVTISSEPRRIFVKVLPFIVKIAADAIALHKSVYTQFNKIQKVSKPVYNMA